MNRTELEAVYELLGQSFSVGRDYFQERLDFDSTYALSTTWVGLQQERITSTIQIFPLHCRIEDAVVKVGGIGSVATAAEAQGQGQGRKMLERLSGWMEQQEYDLSLLFAVINPYYEKAGWITLPEDMYEWDREVIEPSPPAGIDICPFELSDIEDLREIYNQFNANRTSTMIRPEAYWYDRLNWPKWKASTCLVALRNGIPVAYGNISQAAADGTSNIEELCYLDGAESAVIPLLQALLEQRPEAVRFISFLPEDHYLSQALVSLGARKTAAGYMMWKLIRFQPLLVKLKDVLQSRWQKDKAYAGNSFHLALECEGQSAYLHYEAGQIAIESEPRSTQDYSRIVFTQLELITLLLRGYDASVSENPADPVLQVLFPKQPSVFYSLDRF